VFRENSFDLDRGASHATGGVCQILLVVDTDSALDTDGWLSYRGEAVILPSINI
jgi:hypothetical protein